jgi:pimeloyl-ACP methyl ester carboxylesterase
LASIRIGTGPRLHYAEVGPRDGDPVLFLHGWPDSWFSFSRVLPLLPPSIRAIALDQRGFGDSERPDSRYAITDMASDATAFLDALQISLATVVGHSFGSFVARQIAIAHPHRVAGLVLIGTGFAASNPVTRDLQKALHDLPDPIPATFARNFQASTVHHPVPSDFFDQLVAESLKLPPRLWRLAIDRLVEYDDTRQLETIGVPTLLLWGDRDALFSRANQDDFLAALSAARLKVYKDTGHCPNWERPELVAADVANFVQHS